MHAKSVIIVALLLFQAATAPAQTSPAPPGKPEPVAWPLPSAPLDPVSAEEILPLRMVYESTLDSKIEEIVLVTGKEVTKQRYMENEWITVSSMPLDRPALERVLAGIQKEDFRGIVRYTNRYFRDGCPRRMVTPLGEIEEYGIVDVEDTKAFPKAILRLKPLYQLLDRWRSGTDVLGNALEARPGLRQPLPQDEINETLVRLKTGQTVDTTILCRALVSDHNTLRALAARRLGDMNDLTVVQDLIIALSDPSRHDGGNYPARGMDTTRWWANESLKKLTGHDPGYRWDAPMSERDLAIQKWVVWMKGNSLK